MTVSVLLITHENIGTALVDAVDKTFGGLPLPTTCVDVDYKTDPEALVPRLKRLAKNIEAKEGLLVLTDLYGSTPCNIAKSLQSIPRVRVVSGLNLPMLFRVMNYQDQDIDTLAQKAVSGGQDGIIDS